MQFLPKKPLPKAVTAEEIDLPELTRELDKVKSRVFIGRNAAFLGSLMSSVEFLWSYEIETAGTNGEKFWWNPKDFLALPPQERGSTVEHELWHIARMHMVRRGSRDPRLWNIACDIRINRDLRKEGHIINPPMWIPDIPECPYEVEEDIYDWLQAKQEELKLKGLGARSKASGGNNKGDGDPLPCLLQEGNSQDHMLPMPEGGSQTMLGNVVKAMQAAKMANQAGSIPGDIQAMVDKYLTPVVPWHRLLYRHFTQMLEDESTWRRPNRRYTDIYMPSRIPDDGRLEHLAYYFDVSGSVTEHQRTRVVSELKYIKETFRPEKLSIIQFDTRITQEIHLADDDAFNGIKITGLGGTCLKPVREHILKTKPTAAVIFSDLFVEKMEKIPSDIPVIWLCLNNPHAQVDFGKLIHIEE